MMSLQEVASDQCFLCTGPVVARIRTGARWVSVVCTATGYETWLALCGGCVCDSWLSAEKSQEVYGDGDRSSMNWDQVKKPYGQKVQRAVVATIKRKFNQTVSVDSVHMRGPMWNPRPGPQDDSDPDSQAAATSEVDCSDV